MNEDLIDASWLASQEAVLDQSSPFSPASTPPLQQFDSQAPALFPDTANGHIAKVQSAYIHAIWLWNINASTCPYIRLDNEQPAVESRYSLMPDEGVYEVLSLPGIHGITKYNKHYKQYFISATLQDFLVLALHHILMMQIERYRDCFFNISAGAVVQLPVSHGAPINRNGGAPRRR